MRILVLSDLHLELSAPQPAEVCRACGIMYGLGKLHPGIAAPWAGDCEVCGAEGPVTATEDYGLLGADWNLQLPSADNYDLVVLAGDIHKHTRSVTWAAKTFQCPVIVVCGNHELYDAHIAALTEMRKAAAKFEHVHFLENDELILGGTRFLGTELWTNFQLFGADSAAGALRNAQKLMPDFARIRAGGGKLLTPADTVRLHMRAVSFLRERLAVPFDGETVVVTHHLPSMRSVATRFENDLLSAAFASNLDDLVAQADVWIHGHTHTSFDYVISKCRVICNPRGYPLANGKYENPAFDPAKIVELDKSC